MDGHEHNAYEDEDYSINPDADFDTIQTALDADPFNMVLREAEAVCVDEFNQAVLVEERFLKQKAKIQWLREGDSNSAYFHKAVKSRMSRSRIDVITNSDGAVLKNDLVPAAFVLHYEMFISMAGAPINFNSINLFNSFLDEQEANYMIHEVSEQEIKDALFSIRDDKRVHISNQFTYHEQCSKLQLVNLCFVDDLFLFAYGDVGSASVIKEALDKFKESSGLGTSIPKSTAYFCNVLNHVKLSILQILPFVEGTLLVKYPGVPLVSYRLMIRDCNELIDRVQIRIQDWKNKSLSIAGVEENS
nr:reverse transcriptase domain, reverse transcriptase zinc-binding domain protein [Tanacetum cinerariifolium]